MAKRFTDTEKWRKEWFHGLSPLHKLLWIYLCDNCDQSGVFELNFKMISFIIGTEITASDFVYLDEQIDLLPSGKYWIKDFMKFQNSKLSLQSPAHKPIFSLIEKHNLSNRLPDTLFNTHKEIVIVKGMVKEKEIVIDEWKKKIITDRSFLDNACMNNYIELKDLMKYIDVFFQTKKDTLEDSKWNDESDCRRNLLNWIPRYLEGTKTITNKPIPTPKYKLASDD